MPINAVNLEVLKASLSGIVQEMQNSLFRTGFSTIVRESQDASCALMNAKGDVVAQHVVLPLHIGAFPACAAAINDAFGDSIAQGDAFIINHPYHGGSGRNRVHHPSCVTIRFFHSSIRPTWPGRITVVQSSCASIAGPAWLEPTSSCSR